MNDTDNEIVAQHQMAARLAARAEIQDVRLLRTTAEFHRQPDAGRNLTYSLDFDRNVDWDEGETDWFVIRVECSLRINYPDSDETDVSPEDSDDTIATANFEHAALFSCNMRENDEPLTEAELIAYGATTATFALYPFIREYIHDITARLALPPLTIGVLSRPMP